MMSHGNVFRVYTSCLYSPRWKIDDTLENLKAGNTSKSRGEVVTVSRIGRNRFYVLNGNHRVIEDILAGKTTVDVKLDQYTPDMNKTGGAYKGMVDDAVRLVDCVKLTERKDLDAIKRVQPELDLIISGVQDFFRSCSKAFEATDVNDPIILDCANKLMWNGISVGDWSIKWTPAKYVQKGAAASVVTDSKAIDLHCLRIGTRRLYLLLEKYRMHAGTAYNSTVSASWQDSALQALTKIRLEAATAIKGLVAKIASPSLKFFLAHEIHHVDDYKHPWFSKSKMNMTRDQIKAHSTAEKEIRSSKHTKWGLSGKFRTRDTTNPKDFADVVNRRADSMRHDVYNASSHEYNANVRASLPIALKQKTLQKAVEAFKKAYISFNQIPPKLQRKALSRLYQAWTDRHRITEGKPQVSEGRKVTQKFLDAMSLQSRKGKYWLSPAGTLHPLKKNHEDDAVGILNRPDLSGNNAYVNGANKGTSSPASDILYKKGWLRVINYGSDSFMANGKTCNEKQVGVLANCAMNNGIDYVLFDGGNGPRCVWSSSYNKVEEAAPYVLIGCINRDFSVRSKRVPLGPHTTGDMMTTYSHEDLGLEDDFNWRYRPDTKTIYWWNPPVDEDYTNEVLAYIKRKTGDVPAKVVNLDQAGKQMQLDAHGHDLNRPYVESFIQLFEGGIEGTKVTPDEAITACAVRNLKTGEIIEDDYHYEAWEAAWRKGWFKEVGERWPYFADASLKEILDIQPGERGTPGGYEMIGEYIEDGFVTTKGRFLGREEALAIARKARQVNPRMRPDDDMVQINSDGEKVFDRFLRAEEVNYA